MSGRTARRRKRGWVLVAIGLMCLAGAYLQSKVHVMIVWPNRGVPRIYTFWLPDVDDADMERTSIVQH